MDSITLSRRTALLGLLAILISILLYHVDIIQVILSIFLYPVLQLIINIICLISPIIYSVLLYISSAAEAKRLRTTPRVHVEILGHVYAHSDEVLDADASLLQIMIRYFLEDLLSPFLCVIHFIAALLHKDFEHKFYETSPDERKEAYINFALLFISVLLFILFVGSLTNSFTAWMSSVKSFLPFIK